MSLEEVRKAHFFIGSIFLVIGRPLLLDTLAQQQMTRAVRAASLPEAQTALEAAASLGLDVVGPLQTALLSALDTRNVSDESLLMLARLRASHGAIDAAFSEAVESRIQTGLETKNLVLMQRGGQVLALIDSPRAGILANSFNDAGVKALQSGDIEKAPLYLETVQVMDAYDIGRTPQAKSITLLNIGQMRELNATTSTALEAYQSAWTTWAENYEAAYQYSVLSLVVGETAATPDANQLSDARMVAEQAVDRLNCRFGVIATSDNLQPLVVNEQCFRLLTTLAGLDLMLDAESPDAESLVERAIRIAEATDHFAQLPYRVWTAEPYVYASRLTSPVPFETLCAIRAYSNPASDRHQHWVEDATAQLAAEYPQSQCP